ncbi:MAG: hypothetical protein U1F11_01835 [Steroidobacteraceae bacterium]
MVREAGALFGARHYRHYDFLLALSAQFDGIGLEHLQSSENGVGGDYFTEWDTARSDRDLLAHEFVHSWNGKFRRPADLWTPTYNVPMRNSLLWVYEGMTEYWGMVLAARSGLWPESYAREAFAHVAGTFGELRAGRAWRALGDTTHQPIMAYHQPLAYPGWQRSTDYYQEGALLWLDVDARLREASGERRSLDDFAARFAGGREGDAGPSTYTFDDVVATLAAVAPGDWSKLLRARIDGHGGGDADPLAGFARTGWQLVYGSEPNEYVRDLEKLRKSVDHSYSIGLVLGRDDGRVIQSVWDGPAFRAGVATGATVIAVDGRQYSADVLKEALQAAAMPGAREPIELLVKRGDRYQVLEVDWHGGLRYPHLVRIDGAPDRLGALLRPRTGEPPTAPAR